SPARLPRKHVYSGVRDAPGQVGTEPFPMVGAATVLVLAAAPAPLLPHLEPILAQRTMQDHTDVKPVAILNVGVYRLQGALQPLNVFGCHVGTRHRLAARRLALAFADLLAGLLPDQGKVRTPRR